MSLHSLFPTADADAMTISGMVRAAKAILRPPPRERLSRWIESHIRLPAGVSSTPGRVKLWPYQVGIADAIGDPLITRVSMIKPTRAGFSTLLTSAIGSFVANDPGPILLLLPTQDDCRDVVVSDIDPIFGASPALSHMICEDAGKQDRNTLTSRRFAGGSLRVVAARSPRQLRRLNIQYLLCDEIDAYTITDEGNALALAQHRTLQFARRKIIMGSTPGKAHSSNIQPAYDASDKRVFMVPCPQCGHRNEIMWKDIKWPEGEPENAYYLCPENGCVIEESHKPAMVRAGEWVATAPEVKGHAGFRLNALVSLLPNVSWGILAKEWLDAQAKPDNLRVFVNCTLGQTWKDEIEQLDESSLYRLATHMNLSELPPEILFLTCGVDVQRDRLECLFVGFDADDNWYVLDQSVIVGDPLQNDVWIELDEMLKTVWPHPKGGILRVDACCIDASDGTTMDSVTAFTRDKAGRRVVAIKGDDGNRPVITRSATKRAALYIVGVDGLKQRIVDRLTRLAGIKLSDDLEGRFYDELTSERCVPSYHRGRPVMVWERVKGRRAESLDCMVYALAARVLVKLSPERRAEDLQGKPAPKPQRVWQSSYVA